MVCSSWARTWRSRTRSAFTGRCWPNRAGPDIACLGGLIRSILEHERFLKASVVPYTNAATRLAHEYRHEDDDGLFAGFNPATGGDDLMPGAWEYACEPRPDGARGRPRTDPTLQDPM